MTMIATWASRSTIAFLSVPLIEVDGQLRSFVTSIAIRASAPR